MARGYANAASTPKYTANVNHACEVITSPRLETMRPPDRRAAPRRWLRSVHTPRSFFALQRRAAGDQSQPQQQEHAHRCQEQNVHRISQDKNQPEFSQTNKLGPGLKKHGSIYDRWCKDRINAWGREARCEDPGVRGLGAPVRIVAKRLQNRFNLGARRVQMRHQTCPRPDCRQDPALVEMVLETLRLLGRDVDIQDVGLRGLDPQAQGAQSI